MEGDLLGIDAYAEELFPFPIAAIARTVRRFAKIDGKPLRRRFILIRGSLMDAGSRAIIMIAFLSQIGGGYGTGVGSATR